MYLNRSLSGFALLAAASTALAAPSGADAQQGVTITESGNTTTVDVGGAAATSTIINWQDFSIAADETVNFIDNPSAVTLNRVTGDQVSKIYGQMTASGKIFLVNPNGVVFGQNASIDVGGLVASTTDISDANFIAGYQTGRYDFDQASSKIDPTILVEAGGMSIKGSGLAVLVAPSVENLGVIKADLDKIVLASGDIYTLDLYGDDLITFDASNTLQKAQVTNSGDIVAQNNEVDVILTAAVADDLLESVINVDGYIQANSVVLSGDTVTLTTNAHIDAASTDVYYKPTDYSAPIDYAALINGDTQTHLWVNNAIDMQNIVSGTNNYILSNSIDMSGINFTPIGYGTDGLIAYSGIFDFNGQEINHLSIDGSKNYTGLFARLDNATLIDTNLQADSITGGHYTGTLAGQATNSNFLGGLNVTANTVTGLDYTGGVFGNFHSNTVDGDVNVTVNDNIEGRRYVGGLAGTVTGNSSIAANDSLNIAIQGDIISNGVKQARSFLGRTYVRSYDSQVGGVAGLMKNKVGETITLGTVNLTTNDIHGHGQDVGGIAGSANFGGDFLTSDFNVSANTIKSDNNTNSYERNVGGLFGTLYASNTVELGDINVDIANISGANTGGIIGISSADITLNDVSVDADTIGADNHGSVGGLFGFYQKNLIVEGDINITATEIKGANDVGGLFGTLGNTNSEVSFLGDVNINVDKITSDRNQVGGIAGTTALTTINFLDDGNLSAPNLNVSEIYTAGASAGGYFGSIYSSEVNGNLYNYANVSGVYSQVGGIAGYADHTDFNGMMVNYGDISSDAYAVGGIVGYTYDSNLSQVGNEGNVTGTRDVGGIVGYFSDSTLAQAYFTDANAVVRGTENVGGIVGSNVGGSIQDVIVAGNVVATHGAAGGIAGYNDSTIENALVLTHKVTGLEGETGTAIGLNEGNAYHILFDEDIATVDGELVDVVGENRYNGKIDHVFKTKEEYHNNNDAYSDEDFDMNTKWHILQDQPKDYYASLQWCGLACTVELNIPHLAEAGRTSPSVSDKTLMGSDEFFAYYSSLDYYPLLESLSEASGLYAGNKLTLETIEQTIAIETFVSDYYKNKAHDAARTGLQDMDVKLVETLIDISARNE